MTEEERKLLQDFWMQEYRSLKAAADRALKMSEFYRDSK